MAVNIKYTEAERESFKLVPETCPAVESAIDRAFSPCGFTQEEVAAVLAKYGLEASPRLRHALDELIGRRLFARKHELTRVVLYEGTFPLRAALVREVEKSRGMPPGRNHFEEWIAMARR